MHIQKLELIHFKNYEEAAVNFSKGINCIVGLNGSGKTNLLDAIHYLSLTRSAYNSIDSANVKFGETYFSVVGHFVKNDKKLKVVCSYDRVNKKSMVSNGHKVDRLSDHVGNFPVVLIDPYDTDLVRQASEGRRKFFDMAISQADRVYMQALMKYNTLLKQRNAFLKKQAESGKRDVELLQTYDEQLVPLGIQLFKSRKAFITDFEDNLADQYRNLAEEKEKPAIKYVSDYDCEEPMSLLKGKQNQDFLYQRTTFGIHKDDYKFKLDQKPIKKFGSQGQQKSFVIALKLAYYRYLEEITGDSPILLLDDIFDKLDSSRIAHLVQSLEGFGQVFITDARAERTMEIMRSYNIVPHYLNIMEGKVHEAE